MAAKDSSASETMVVGRDRVLERLQAILRAAQTSWTDKALEDASGVDARAIKSYRVEGKEPPLSAALSLLVALGAPRFNPVLALAGVVASPLDEADELRPMQLVADMMTPLATIAAAAADGRIDHIERPSCTEAADMIIATVLPLSSRGEPN